MKNKEMVSDWLKRARSNWEKVGLGNVLKSYCMKISASMPSKRLSNESITWTDKLNAKYLILHAGHGSMEDARDVLREIADDRLLIENVPKVGLNDEPMIGYSPAQIEELIGDGDRGLCLDLNHAAKAAVSLGVDYRECVQDFLVFDPKMFHISDGTLDNEKDEHLNIGEGDYDFKVLMNCVNKSEFKYVTLETPRTKLGSFEDDLKNLGELASGTSYNIGSNREDNGSENYVVGKSGLFIGN